jgi:hypothetical protein
MRRDVYENLIAMGVAEDRAFAIASRTGLGWSEPITDEGIRRRALEFANSPITPVGEFVPHDGSTSETVRSRAAIDAAMASLDPRLSLSVTDAELDGALSADAMRFAAHLEGKALPEVPAWLARRGGISDAAKVLAAIVLEIGPCRDSDVWAHIGNALGESEWGHFLAEAIAVGIVNHTSDRRLIALRVIK